MGLKRSLPTDFVNERDHARTLIKRAYVFSMDAEIGDIICGDVLIEPTDLIIRGSRWI